MLYEAQQELLEGVDYLYFGSTSYGGKHDLWIDNKHLLQVAAFVDDVVARLDDANQISDVPRQAVLARALADSFAVYWRREEDLSNTGELPINLFDTEIQIHLLFLFNDYVNSLFPVIWTLRHSVPSVLRPEPLLLRAS